MTRLWAKIIKDNKIVKQTVFEKEGRLVWGELHEYLAEIAYALDIPTPVLLRAHIMNLAKFNHVKFKESDFVEPVGFDSLFVENISDR